ncbi:MAG: transglycosylase SLT domain-containing protein [Acetobacteraceae bacterium]
MRRIALLLVLLCAVDARGGHARPALPTSIPAPSALCRSAILAAERATRVPDRLLDAIAVVESGRRDPVSGAVYPWPWTINAEGVGHFYESKAEAIAAAQAFQANGVRSIDVGCMQVNLMHHPDAFASLDQAFDPMANAAYAARFLTQLFSQTNAWPLAAAAYHSFTPDLGAEYAPQGARRLGRPTTVG